MEDFEDIPHTGGKIEIYANGTMRLSHVTAKPSAWFQLCVSFNNIPLFPIRMGGIGSLPPNMPTGSFPVPISCDEKGFFERECKACNGYFRSKSAPFEAFCPYCGIKASTINFITPSQQKYIEAIMAEVMTVIGQRKDCTIDIDQLLKKVGNTSPFTYSQQKQQTEIHCKSCHNQTDILGIHGACHKCGKRNTLDLLESSLDGFQDRVSNPKFTREQREKREQEWREVIVGCISEFEAFCRDLRDELLKIPMIGHRKKALTEVNFQQLTQAAATLKEVIGSDIQSGLSEDDKIFLQKFFQARHIFTHNKGKVDQEYIDKSKDTSVRLGQVLKARSSNANNIITLVRLMSRNFFSDYEEIVKK